MDDVLSAEVWDFFVKKLPKNEKDRESEREIWTRMEWFVQTEEMRSKLVRSTISASSGTEIRIRIPLMTRIFELIIRKPELFPESQPILEGEFLSGFTETFEWSPSSNLLELTEQYTDYCQNVDMAILEIKEAENDGFVVEELEIDEEEPEHLLVKIYSEKYKEHLEMSVAIDDFQGFPRVLRCLTNPQRTASFDCEKWNSEEKLGKNLKRLYGEEERIEYKEEIEEQKEDKDSFDGDDDEIMDFI